MINHKITIKEIGTVFAKSGYILSDSGIMQYNDYLSAFEFVSDNEILTIFKRLYPNLERRVLKVEMITPYLPVISDSDFASYNLCKKVDKYNLNEAKLNQEIQKIVEYNNNRKRDIPGIIDSNDYDSCIQLLINNDIYTDHTILFKYTDNDFESFGLFDVKHLFKNVTMDNILLDDIARIVYIGLNDLTYITEVKEDLDIKHLENNTITNEDWRTYQRIKDIVKTAKEYLSNDK